MELTWSSPPEWVGYKTLTANKRLNMNIKHISRLVPMDPIMCPFV